VVNTEKLERCGAVESKLLPGLAQPVPTLLTEAGVVTRRVARPRARRLRFASIRRRPMHPLAATSR